MSAMDCVQLADAAPELALGILPGDERADAIAHLDDCAHCQQLVGSFTVVTDQLLRLGPRAQPSPGFTGRAMRTISAARSAVNPKPPTARRRVPGAVLAVAAVVVVLLTLGVAFGLVGPSSRPSVAAAEMQTDSGNVVGEIFVHDGPPAKVFMSLPGWDVATGPYGEPASRYSLLITRDAGPALVVPVTMSNDATWAATVDGVAADQIASAALLDSAGRVWCSATF